MDTSFARQICVSRKDGGDLEDEDFTTLYHTLDAPSSCRSGVCTGTSLEHAWFVWKDSALCDAFVAAISADYKIEDEEVTDIVYTFTLSPVGNDDDHEGGDETESESEWESRLLHPLRVLRITPKHGSKIKQREQGYLMDIIGDAQGEWTHPRDTRIWARFYDNDQCDAFVKMMIDGGKYDILEETILSEDNLYLDPENDMKYNWRPTLD